MINTAASTFSTDESTAEDEFGNDEILSLWIFRNTCESMPVIQAAKALATTCQGLKEGIGFMPIDPMKSDENGATKEEERRRRIRANDDCTEDEDRMKRRSTTGVPTRRMNEETTK